jgi:hypothetical protein
MNQQANNSSTTNLSRISMSSRVSALSNQQRHSLPSQERMTITMLLRPQSKNRNHPGRAGDEDSSVLEARRSRLCSYLQEALNLTVSDLYENTIEDKWE